MWDAGFKRFEFKSRLRFLELVTFLVWAFSRLLNGHDVTPTGRVPLSVDGCGSLVAGWQALRGWPLEDRAGQVRPLWPQEDVHSSKPVAPEGPARSLTPEGLWPLVSRTGVLWMRPLCSDFSVGRPKRSGHHPLTPDTHMPLHPS